MVEGPFRQFHGDWRLVPLADQGCRVAFDLSYQSSEGVFDQVAKAALDRIFGSVVEAFVKRAEATLTPLVAAAHAAPAASPGSAARLGSRVVASPRQSFGTTGQVSLAWRSSAGSARQRSTKSRTSRRAPGGAIGLPGVVQRVAAQVGRRERKRVEKLDLAVGHDEEHRLRALEARLHLGDDVPGVDRQRRTGSAGRRPLAQRSDGALPFVVAAGRACPRPRRRGRCASAGR